MPTSPSVQHCLPLSQTSENNRFECSADLKINSDDKSENEMKKTDKHYLKRPFYRKQFSFSEQYPRTAKRRNTFSSHQDCKYGRKKRRMSNFEFPNKFLLGGCRADPLNLRSLEDETINKELNAFSPIPSPMSTPMRNARIEVYIPRNVHDPLNLMSGEETIFCPKSKKRRRHRKSRHDDCENHLDMKDFLPTEEKPNIALDVPPQRISSPQHTDKSDLSIDEKVLNALEETFVAANESAKSCNNNSFKRNEDHVQKQPLKQKRVKSKPVITKEFHVKAEKYCYGNHVLTYTNWSIDGNPDSDERLNYLTADLFQGKFVLDIGCNTGKLTFFIAKNMHPKKIIGIDICGKLINLAQRQIRETHETTAIAEMPKCLATMYGSLAKICVKSSSSTEFPNNIHFLKANYVPPKEDYLVTQKPEYDTILCLRVTKWIHLNFGDAGLKMAFKRMYAQLRVGGQLILEPQPWFTYSASKRITPSIKKTYSSLQLKPDDFCQYLLSEEVGFSTCHALGKASNYVKNYRQQLLIFTKTVDKPVNSGSVWPKTWDGNVNNWKSEFPDFGCRE